MNCKVLLVGDDGSVLDQWNLMNARSGISIFPILYEIRDRIAEIDELEDPSDYLYPTTIMVL